MWVDGKSGRESVRFGNESFGGVGEFGRLVWDVVFCGGVKDFPELVLPPTAGGR